MKNDLLGIMALILLGLLLLPGCSLIVGKRQDAFRTPAYCYPCIEFHEVGGIGIVLVPSKKGLIRGGYFLDQ